MKHRISPLTRLVLLSGVFAAVTAAAIAQTTPPQQLFQLDGNTKLDLSSGYSFNPCSYYGGVTDTCDDWDLLNGPPAAKGHSVINQFLDGTASTNSFTQGGSKDFNPISKWRWSSSPTPNKDTLNGGYAALYHASAGDYALVFGANRASPNGDANIGIWFFKGTVTTASDGSFSGSHQNGDLFIISAFTGGGGNSNISVYEWDDGCSTGVKNPQDGDCADSNLKLIHSQASSVSCNGSLYCAVTNAATVTSSWDGDFISPTFFEGGINLSAVYGGSSAPCFSSFLLETRSSQSTSAVLKDFLVGGFPVCGMKIAKQCSYPASATGWTVSSDGKSIVYSWTGTVTNTGVGTISDVQVTDYLPDATTGAEQKTTGTTALLYTDTTYTTELTDLGPGATGYFKASEAVSALSATNDASASGDAGGGTSNATDAAGKTITSAKCVAALGGTVDVQKSCGPPAPGTYLDCSGGSGPCVVKAAFTAKVCNNGAVQLTNVTLSDDPAATLSGNNFTLDPKGSVDKDGNATDCATVTGSYTPKNYSSTADLGRYFFDDTISVTNATPAIPGTVVKGNASACPAGSSALACAKTSCPLCGQGECVGDTQ